MSALPALFAVLIEVSLPVQAGACVPVFTAIAVDAVLEYAEYGQRLVSSAVRAPSGSVWRGQLSVGPGFRAVGRTGKDLEVPDLVVLGAIDAIHRWASARISTHPFGDSSLVPGVELFLCDVNLDAVVGSERADPPTHVAPSDLGPSAWCLLPSVVSDAAAVLALGGQPKTVTLCTVKHLWAHCATTSSAAPFSHRDNYIGFLGVIGTEGNP